METKNLYDGLLIKTNDFTKTGHSDCALCCFSNSDAECEDCPLKRGFYFAKPVAPPVSPAPSSMSISDITKIDSIISDLDWISKHLKDSKRLHLLSFQCVELAKTYMDCSLSRLNRISSFDD